MADITIIGAGLAGLACGRVLAEANVDFEILESSERVGGRVRSDNVDGFTLDHGFQVLLTAYPACQRLLDYKQLRLRTFDPGAMIRANGKFHILGDPWRKPTQIFKTAFAPVGSLGDKLKIAKLRSLSQSGSLEELYLRPQDETEARLRDLGFSSRMIELFFRPFFSGVFLESKLNTSSRMMEFVFRMFASGPVAIPADGMAAIGRQLAEHLPRGCLKLNQTAQQVLPTAIQMSDDSSHAPRPLSPKHIVLATESKSIPALMGQHFPTDEFRDRTWQKTVCIYFSTNEPPHNHKLLLLRGDDASGPINNVAVISNVAQEYAPPGKCLISVSLVENEVSNFDSEQHDACLDRVVTQLRSWFGEQVDHWDHLRTYHIPYALPSQSTADFEPVVRSVEPWGSDGPICCGDHRETSSIQGALNSGIRAAETMLKRLRK